MRREREIKILEVPEGLSMEISPGEHGEDFVAIIDDPKTAYEWLQERVLSTGKTHQIQGIDVGKRIVVILE